MPTANITKDLLFNSYKKRILLMRIYLHVALRIGFNLENIAYSLFLFARYFPYSLAYSLITS